MAGDPYWYDNVKLLLPMTGSNNSTTFTDLERVTKAVTPYGNAKIITSQADPFGKNDGVAYFDGNGDYCLLPYSDDFNLGLADFHIDALIYPVSFSSGEFTIIAAGWRSTQSDGGGWVFRITNSNIMLESVRIGSAILSLGNYSFNPGNWYYVEALRNSDGLLFRVNGSLITPNYNFKTENLNNPNSRNAVVGSSGNSSSWAVWPSHGYVSNLRLTKGVSRDYEAPTGPFPDYNSQISGKLLENILADQFIAESYNVRDGALSGRTLFSGSDFTINVKSVDMSHMVSLRPDIGDVWKPNTGYLAGQKVFPNNPKLIPYYYSRLVDGTSGTVEPAWSTVPASQIDDGVVSGAWSIVERIPAPQIKGPLISA